MSKTLQEQLVAAGLASEKAARKSSHEKRKKRKRGTPDAESRQAKRALTEAEKLAAERSRELNRKRAEAVRQRASAAAIRQLLQAHKLDRSKADMDYRFVYRNKVRQVRVTPELRQQVIAGTLSIVAFNGRLELVPAAIGRRIAEHQPSALVDLDRTEPQPRAATEDPYAEYQVPDDLIW